MTPEKSVNGERLRRMQTTADEHLYAKWYDRVAEPEETARKALNACREMTQRAQRDALADRARRSARMLLHFAEAMELEWKPPRDG